MEALDALRQLFFMGAGDWAAALVEGLCAAAGARGSVAAGDLQTVLEESLKVRSHEISWDLGLLLVPPPARPPARPPALPPVRPPAHHGCRMGLGLGGSVLPCIFRMFHP